jgi:hypothetical protein
MLPEFWASRLFMELSSLQDSVLESRVFEDGFGVESISTAELFGLANATGTPLVTIDEWNLAEELAALDLPENIAADIENAVYQKLKVTIPRLETVYEDWLGTGWLKENPVTGEAGWMLSGMIAGGMTVLNPDRWPGDYVNYISNAFNRTPNPDPNAAVEIKIIPATDQQEGVVGQPLSEPMMVMALDRTGAPVKDVPITFQVKGGGGVLQVVDQAALVYTSDQITTIKTNYNGIAKIRLYPKFPKGHQLKICHV